MNAKAIATRFHVSEPAFLFQDNKNRFQTNFQCDNAVKNPAYSHPLPLKKPTLERAGVKT
jgi:hypothetical protein